MLEAPKRAIKCAFLFLFASRVNEGASGCKPRSFGKDRREPCRPFERATTDVPSLLVLFDSRRQRLVGQGLHQRRRKPYDPVALDLDRYVCRSDRESDRHALRGCQDSGSCSFSCSFSPVQILAQLRTG